MITPKKSKTRPKTSSQSPAHARRRQGPAPGSAIKLRPADLPCIYAQSHFRDINSSKMFNGTAIEVEHKARKILVAFLDITNTSFAGAAYWVTIAQWNAGDLRGAEISTVDLKNYPTTKPKRSGMSSILSSPMAKSNPTKGKSTKRSRGDDNQPESRNQILIKGRSTKDLPAKHTFRCTTDRYGTPTVRATVFNPEAHARVPSWSAQFQGHSCKIEHRRGVVLTARLYVVLVKMKMNENRNQQNQLPVTFRRFDHNQIKDLAEHALDSQNNSATCLSTALLHNAWKLVRVGNQHIYTYLNKKNSMRTLEMFPELKFKVKRLAPTTTAATFGRTLKTETSKEAANEEITERKKETESDVGLRHDPKRTAFGRAMNASYRGRKKNAPTTASGRRSTVEDETMTQDDLHLLLGGRMCPGIVKLLQSQVNKKRFQETMQLCGIENKDVALNHHIAYMASTTFVAPEIAVNLKQGETAEMKPADETMHLLMQAQADPAGALRDMKHSTLKVFLVTLLVTSFDTALSDATLDPKVITQGAFNPDRKSDIKNFAIKAKKIIALMTIILNAMNPRQTRTSIEGLHRAFISVHLALDSTGGVTDKTLDLLKETGLTLSSADLRDVFQEMGGVLTPYWMWEREFHASSASGVDDKSRRATVVTADNADCKNGNDVLRDMANMITIAATTIGELRLSKEEQDLLKQVASSRANPATDGGSRMPAIGDEKFMSLTSCETKKYMQSCRRRVLLALMYAGLTKSDVNTEAEFRFAPQTLVDLRLNTTNYVVSGTIVAWNGATNLYLAQYGSDKCKKTDSFTPQRVALPNSKINPMDVDDEAAAEEEETSPKLELNELKCAPSETMVTHVMEGVSSKKSEATAQMTKAARASLVSGGYVEENGDGVIRGGFADGDSLLFVTVDFEFAKSIMEQWLLDAESKEFGIVAYGHLAKAMSTKLLAHNEQGAARPLLGSIDKSYGTPSYKQVLKGRNINRSIKEALRESMAMLVVLCEAFVEERGDLKVDPTGISDITIRTYLSDPSQLVDLASRTTGFVLQHDARPEMLPMDKFGEFVIDLFHTWLSNKSKMAFVPPSDRAYLLHTCPPTIHPNVNPNPTPVNADNAEVPAVVPVVNVDLQNTIVKLEYTLKFVTSWMQIKKMCRIIGSECEQFEWSAFVKQQDVLRRKLYEYKRAILVGSSPIEAAAAANAVTKSSVMSEIEGVKVPEDVNLNLCWMARMTLGDGAALQYLQLQTRIVVSDATPTIVVDDPNCTCGYPHNRCYCNIGAFVALKVALVSVFGHNQYNYQYTLLYQLLSLVGTFHHKDIHAQELVLHHMNGACSLSLTGNAERGLSGDMNQEHEAVLKTKRMHQPNRPFKGIAQRTVALQVRDQLERRARLKAEPASSLPVSQEKKTLWRRENDWFLKQVATARALVAEALEKPDLNEVVLNNGRKLLKPKRMYNNQCTSSNQLRAASTAFVTALSLGVAPKLPPNPIAPNKSISVEPTSKDKQAKDDKKERSRVAKAKRQRLLNAQVESGQMTFVPDDLGQLQDPPTSSNKASMVLDLVKLLLGVVNADDLGEETINHDATKSILRIFKNQKAMHVHLRQLDVNNTGGTFGNGRARNGGGGWLKFLDFAQETLQAPNFRRIDGVLVQPTFCELGRAMLLKVIHRHLADRATQVLFVNWDAAAYMTVLRELINTKRGKQQDDVEIQKAKYANISPSQLYLTKGTYQTQMKSKHGFIVFMANIMAHEMTTVNATEKWDFPQELRNLAGQQATMVLCGGGADVVTVATGRESDDTNLIKLFPDSDPISVHALRELLAPAPYQAEGERMNLYVLWKIYRHGIAHHRRGRRWQPRLLLICNDADVILQGMTPIMLALNGINNRYKVDIGEIDMKIYCQVKSKSVQVLEKVGAMWGQDLGGTSSGIAFSGHGMCTVIDFEKLFNAIESFQSLPTYLPGDGEYVVGTGLRAASMTDGAFLYNGSDYVSRLKNVSYRHWWRAMMSPLHRGHVQQIMLLGGTGTLFNIDPPTGLAARLRADLAADDSLGTLAPTFTMNVDGFHLLYYAMTVLRPKTSAYLAKLFATPNPVATLAPKNRWDIILVCAALAGETTLPLPHAGLLTRCAQLNAVAPQFANWIFLDHPSIGDDPFKKSPFYRDRDGFVREQWRPNPRIGNALANDIATKSKSHFGDHIYNLPPHPAALARVFPFHAYHTTIHDCMENNGSEKPRTISLSIVHPKLTASSLVEVAALKTARTSGTGKFAATKGNVVGFNKVVSNTCILCTSYTRLSTSTTLEKIIRRSAGAIMAKVSDELVDLLVPTSMADVATGKAVVLQLPLVQLLKDVDEGSEGSEDLLFNILRYVVSAYLAERTEIDDENDEEEEEADDDDDDNDDNDDNGDGVNNTNDTNDDDSNDGDA